MALYPQGLLSKITMNLTLLLFGPHDVGGALAPGPRGAGAAIGAPDLGGRGVANVLLRQRTTCEEPGFLPRPHASERAVDVILARALRGDRFLRSFLRDPADPWDGRGDFVRRALRP